MNVVSMEIYYIQLSCSVLWSSPVFFDQKFFHTLLGSLKQML
uniref:Uncharacterized protein n=1 Tax=Anguilla anguilla TaxID=7936 RepID=A0A0E9Q6V4_ANGAN